MQRYTLTSPLYVPSFSLIVKCVCVLWPKMQSVWIEKGVKKEMKMKFCLLVSQDRLVFKVST